MAQAVLTSRIPEALLTKEEVAEWLNVSPRTIERWVSMRMIPFHKIGQAVRFKRQDIEDWIESKRTKVHKIWR